MSGRELRPRTPARARVAWSRAVRRFRSHSLSRSCRRREAAPSGVGGSASARSARADQLADTAGFGSQRGAERDAEHAHARAKHTLTDLRLQDLRIERASQSQSEEAKRDEEKDDIRHDHGAQRAEHAHEESEEAELAIDAGEPQVQFLKENFRNLEVLGQYNNGFLVTYLAANGELFIIDQHASDEKHNFENLLRQPLKSQPLVSPIRIDCQQIEIEIVRQNAHVFEQNGFRFEIEEAGGRSCVLLRSLPFQDHNLRFDRDDFLEIFNHLSLEHANTFFRPYKIQKKIATRACHMSITIGDALKRPQMRQILENLARLESPWNCPHGRPTMIKTSNLQDVVDKIHYAQPYDL